MNDQQLKVFLEYTRRFEDISADLPTFFRLNEKTSPVGRGDSDTSTEGKDPDFEVRFMLRYLNISSEEWYLYESKLITDEVWGMWRHYIVTTLAGNKKFGEFWWDKCRVNLLDANKSPTKFVEFVDAILPQPPVAVDFELES
jgi:hypothetical protein